MKALLWRLLIQLWLKQPISKRLPWTEEDQVNLNLFLSSGQGKRFILKLREAAADSSFRSVYAQSSEAVSSAGYARGFCDCLGLVLRLGQSFPVAESEYEPAEHQRIAGQPAREQGWPWPGSGGGGGVIAP